MSHLNGNGLHLPRITAAAAPGEYVDPLEPFVQQLRSLRGGLADQIARIDAALAALASSPGSAAEPAPSPLPTKAKNGNVWTPERRREHGRKVAQARARAVAQRRSAGRPDPFPDSGDGTGAALRGATDAA